MTALAALIRVTFEHHDRNPHLARLVQAENALGAVGTWVTNPRLTTSRTQRSSSA